MSNNKKIETLGVSYLASFINKHELLQTYFDSNDKTPAWDGEIHILKSASESTVFDEELAEAIGAYEKRNYQNEDKMITPSLVKDLNISVQDRIKTIVVNMER